MYLRQGSLICLFALFISSFFCEVASSETIKPDWIKVGEGTIALGSVQSYVDMNDIRRLDSDIISFRFATNVVSANASNVITVLLNCRNDLYNIIDDRVYSGLFGNGAASDSISHGKDFIVVKGTQFESVSKLVCAKKV